MEIVAGIQTPEKHHRTSRGAWRRWCVGERREEGEGGGGRRKGEDSRR